MKNPSPIPPGDVGRIRQMPENGANNSEVGQEVFLEDLEFGQGLAVGLGTCWAEAAEAEDTAEPNAGRRPTEGTPSYTGVRSGRPGRS